MSQPAPQGGQQQPQQQQQQRRPPMQHRGPQQGGQQQQQQQPLLQHPSQQQFQPQFQQQQPPFPQQQQQGLLPHPQFQQGPPPPGHFPPQGPPPGMFQQGPPPGMQGPPPGHFMHGPPQPHMQGQHHPQQRFQGGPPPQGFSQQGPPPPQFAQPPPFPPQSHHQPPPPPAQEHDPFLSHVVSASLVDLLGKQTLVLLRDGRKLIGELLSFDQYSNIVLSGTVERKYVAASAEPNAPMHYFDAPLGLYIIRGENVVLLGDQSAARAGRQGVELQRVESKDEFAKLEEAERKRKEDAGIKIVKSSVLRGEEDDLQ